MAATPTGITRIVGDDPSVVDFLDLLRQMMVHSLRTDLQRGELLPDSAALERYLRATMAHRPEEQVRVLFLNARNELLRDEVMFQGSVSGAQLYPREIMKRALEIGSTALILVHNHPSGDPTPSAADISETGRFCQAAAALDIVVHDHLVIARRGTLSFRRAGLLPGRPTSGLGLQDGRSSLDLAAFAASLQAARAKITRFFEPVLFADPAYDLLLFLFAAGEIDGPVSIKSCTAATGLPATTTLRWIATLVERDMVVRGADTHDARCTLISLTPEARDTMRAYLSSILFLPLVPPPH